MIQSPPWVSAASLKKILRRMQPHGGFRDCGAWCAQFPGEMSMLATRRLLDQVRLVYTYIHEQIKMFELLYNKGDYILTSSVDDLDFSFPKQCQRPQYGHG
jgi:hypothetical protein